MPPSPPPPLRYLPPSLPPSLPSPPFPPFPSRKRSLALRFSVLREPVLIFSSLLCTPSLRPSLPASVPFLVLNAPAPVLTLAPSLPPALPLSLPPFSPPSDQLLTYVGGAVAADGRLG